MAGMIATNGKLGVSSFHGNGVFASKCRQTSFSSCGFSLIRRPNFGIGLNVKNRRRNCGTVTRAGSNGGSDSKLVGGSLLEKEFEFKPSFDDYLKVMESVRTVRDKKQKSTHNLRETFLSEGNEESVRLGKSEERLDRGKALDFVDKDESFKSRDGVKKKESQRKKITELKGRFEGTENNWTGRGKRKPVRSLTGRKWSKQQTREEDAEANNYNIDMRREHEDKANSSRVLGNKRSDDSIWNDGSMAKAGVREETGVVNNKWRERNRIQDNKVIDKDIVPKHGRINRRTEVDDKSLREERAAFRNFDDYNDILGKPRLPRMEMDERIQKLAMSLNGADVDMPEWMFSKMMRSARIIFTDHSISRVIQILGKFGNWRRVVQVIEWLQIRERFKSHKLRYIYTTALNVLGKARRPVEALNVFNAMLQHMSSYPDLVAYHSIAVTLGQAGYMKELFDVIDTMRSPPKKKFKTGALGKWDPRVEPDIIMYNAVLNACVQRKQWEGAFWVLQQLKEKALNPSVTTYGLVMEVMLVCGKYNLVHDFFRKVQKSSIPNALTYRVLLNTLSKEGKLDEAVLAVQNMEKRGIVGSAALYYDLARCLCSAGRCQEALMQIDKICKVASKPLVVTYTGLIQACLDSGNIEDGAYIFNHMKDFCSRNLVTCNIMLKGYLKHGKFKEAKELFEKMLQDASLIKSKADHKALVAPDIYTFNTMFDACITEKKWDDFEYAYKKMLHHGYHFNAKRHLQMILNASRVGKFVNSMVFRESCWI
ncbi:pentatricopeptide repeat-containing protein At1g30610, chloroplastic isoform X2 [Morus notabilis]|uniref:pentatricopeptide repeat-containing protein At1g30610, chloroplastic isoform X2 n=1 Tax=Morus notabilis TaxID=981085 RepID=UPI000CED2EE8|nr:pentatricopeptide repeat-containing protein At1g30610, chloroplastic isoform X2 [Morus notabilis]